MELTESGGLRPNKSIKNTVNDWVIESEVQVNGVCFSLRFERGIRQARQISPILFALSVEAITKIKVIKLDESWDCVLCRRHAFLRCHSWEHYSLSSRYKFSKGMSDAVMDHRIMRWPFDGWNRASDICGSLWLIIPDSVTQLVKTNSSPRSWRTGGH